jgi:hypothetical protein
MMKIIATATNRVTVKIARIAGTWGRGKKRIASFPRGTKTNSATTGNGATITRIPIDASGHDESGWHTLANLEGKLRFQARRPTF